ncbi:hypothetical protein [Amycolatopsis sacchari]|uniref:hypothetical protein n=1 Tax=Amycolatopsis sacchari TaxID=115433 RepID=UPI003D723B25
MADSHDFAVRLEDLHSVGPRSTDTLYSQFDTNVGDMHSTFFTVLNDLSGNLALAGKAVLEIVRRYQEADQKAAAQLTALHQDLEAT